MVGRAGVGVRSRGRADRAGRTGSLRISSWVSPWVEYQVRPHSRFVPTRARCGASLWDPLASRSRGARKSSPRGYGHREAAANRLNRGMKPCRPSPTSDHRQRRFAARRRKCAIELREARGIEYEIGSAAIGADVLVRARPWGSRRRSARAASRRARARPAALPSRRRSGRGAHGPASRPSSSGEYAITSMPCARAPRQQVELDPARREVVEHLVRRDALAAGNRRPAPPGRRRRSSTRPTTRSCPRPPAPRAPPRSRRAAPARASGRGSSRCARSRGARARRRRPRSSSRATA